MAVNFAHSLNAEEPIEVMVPLAITLCKLVQPLKVLEGISVIEAGSTTLVRAVQSENKLPPVITSPSGREMLVKEMAPLKTAGAVMRLRVEGKFTTARESQLRTMELPESSSTPSSKVSV